MTTDVVDDDGYVLEEKNMKKYKKNGIIYYCLGFCVY